MKKIIMTFFLLAFYPFKNEAGSISGNVSTTIYCDAYESDYQNGTIENELFGGELIDYYMWVQYESWPRNGHASVRFGNETIAATITNPSQYYRNKKQFTKNIGIDVSYGVYVIDTGAAGLEISW
ncbi:hypothetical protein [Pedobacter duraquae]|uniref:Uncharacterized protein n=1 Tax=Pedobacter duraquae TaxID=425511 RepID=A0A4R6ID83_9SPHI|nr:hypothetical protein [Pedobacter duraquae]TDO20240.1 hypothetical protein CLV32_4000 [Pedobacter duraquae]